MYTKTETRRESERQRYRDTERQRDRDIERQRDRETESQRDRERETYTETTNRSLGSYACVCIHIMVSDEMIAWEG